MNRLHALVLAAVSSLAFVVGCSSAKDDANTMSLTKGCLATRCEQRQSDRSSQCSSCMTACFGASYDCDVDAACDYSCSDDGTDCSDSDRKQCAETGWKAELPPGDPSVQAACEAMVASFNTCGGSPSSDARCKQFAKVEKPATKPYYDCTANLPCDADQAAMAGCGPAPTTFGDELCAPVSDDCSDLCNDEGRELLNTGGGWLREDVMKAAMDCRSAGSCEEVHACMAAWWKAVID
ncbi:MAG: hypothetical protein JWP97_508 [Labilithrix sp.]|nr:hypothetical protein [Labilithrix sp.]